jgi:hypothetical protein
MHSSIWPQKLQVDISGRLHAFFAQQASIIRILSILSSHQQGIHIGWRSAVSDAVLRSLAEHAGMMVERQFVYWDEIKKVGVPTFGDSITVLTINIERHNAAHDSAPWPSAAPCERLRDVRDGFIM